MLELVFVERSAPKAVTEDVPPSAVLAVESLRIVAVQDLHAIGEILARRIEHQVVVRCHQAERVTCPLVLVGREGEKAEKVPPIVGVVEIAIFATPRVVTWKSPSGKTHLGSRGIDKTYEAPKRAPVPNGPPVRKESHFWHELHGPIDRSCPCPWLPCPGQSPPCEAVRRLEGTRMFRSGWLGATTVDW